MEVGGFYGGVVLAWWSLGGLRLLDEGGGVLDFGCVLNVCLVVGLWVIWGGVGSSVFLRARCRVECGGLGWVG